MTDAASPDDVQVGYKRPPRHSRFRPGQSGNPRGRQKGMRNFATDLRATLEASVALNDKGKARRVSTQEAALLRLKEKALKGDARALDRLIDLARIFNGGAEDHTLGEPGGSAEDQALLDAYIAAANSLPPGATATDAEREESDGHG